MEQLITQQQVNETLEEQKKKAKKLFDENKVDQFLLEAEEMLKEVPVVGEKLSYLPVLVSTVKSYIKKEYTEVATGSILAIVGALLYILKKKDLIPDDIPLIGQLDDVLILDACFKFIKKDVIKYKKWQENNRPIEVS